MTIKNITIIQLSCLAFLLSAPGCQKSESSSETELTSIELPNPGDEEETKKATIKSDSDGVVVASVNADADKAQVVAAFCAFA